MIILENVIRPTRVMYLRRDDIMLIEEEELDDSTDVVITFKENVMDNDLTIEDVSIAEVTSKIDSGDTVKLIREFYLG